MPLSDEDALRIVARLRVLEHVVGAMFRDLATATGRTADDVARHAEEIKEFFERNVPAGLNEIHLNAAVDRLFQQIVADMRSEKG
jgi:hypothetical protein